MNTTERKYKIIKQLLKVEEEAVLYKIEKVLEEENSIHPLLLQLLEASNLEAEKNKGQSHSDVMSKLKEKYLAKNDVVQLTDEQIIMLEMSENDIKNGNLISQEAMNKRNLEWLNEM